MTKANKSQRLLLRLKNKKLKSKKTKESFIFECQMFLYLSVYMHSTDLLKTIFKMKINTLVTKYTDILIFNLSSVVHNATFL